MAAMFSLRDDANLREFVLENVEHFGEERVLGTGSYGSVQEVMINGEVYAAKKIHEVLLETDKRGGVANIAGNYHRECRLMARIRHPNITQFIGLCFVTGSRLPLLVMERLDSSLDDLLESTPNIPLSVCQYILVCVAQGLLHLHCESVIHRDLTARNVLLTVSLRAKITDFGNSRIVNLEPGRLARTLTRFPGTLVYMPPEALSDGGHSVYGPSLDVFSFGVLQLFALTQVFPGDLLAPTYSDPNNPDHLLARSEFERRGPYTALLERSLAGGREHPLFGLVRECLANTPERRPATTDLLSSLEEVGREMDGGLLQLDIARVKTARTLRAKEKRIEVLQREVVEKDRILERKDEQLTEKDALLAQKDEEVADKDTQLARQQQISNSVRADAATKDGMIADKDRQLSELESTIISQREAALVERDALLQGPPLRELRPPLTLKRGKDMPIEMGTSVQNGDTVYVGGDNADNDRDVAATDAISTDQNRGPINNDDKYEEIRKAAASLTPKSMRKIDAVLTEVESTTPAKSISILLTGKTCVGKSTLANGILGLEVDDDRAAQEGGSIKARCTTEVRMHQQNKNGVLITVWDSPGLQDGTEDQDQYLQQIKLKCSQRDLTMYCIKMIETRFFRGHDNPDVVAMEKFTKAFGYEFWKSTIIVLTYANTMEAFNVEWEDLSKLEKAKAFEAEVQEWKDKIRLILIDDIKVPQKIVHGIRIVPAGHARRPNLPGIEYWLTHLWFQCVWTMPTEGARIAMVKINEKRMKNEDDVREDGVTRWTSADQQPLVVVGDSSAIKVVAISGTSGGAAGATVGALIGLIGGPPGAALGATIGGLIGATVGGGAGGIYKHVTK
ncbi:uncharacterized protein LOC135337596 isoform X2 [Halichondria panicea]|uniref:uncharacterized protein LOC135337596 isoform X2 n=1 Tax=Halichondria panicea TaxID=6063 RepID=UPI00312B6687